MFRYLFLITTWCYCFASDPLLEDRMRLFYEPDNVTLQDVFLEKLQASCPLKFKGNKRLVLGLGTGRCGSVSLTTLLRAQEGCYAAHESLPLLKWTGENKRLLFHKKRLDTLLRAHEVVAEVAHYYLPYVEQILTWYPDARVIVLKRDRAQTVNSFKKMVPHLNHWMDTGAKKNAWDETFPTFRAHSKTEAIEKYWDLYYQTIEALMKKYPGHIRLYATEDLNQPLNQLEILEFCGIKLPRIISNLRCNALNNRDGVGLY